MGHNRGAAVEADAIGEQQPMDTIGEQLKRTQSRAAAEVDTRCKRGAAVEADRYNRARSSS